MRDDCGVPLADLSLAVAMTDAQGRPAVGKKRLSPMPDYACEVELDVKGLSPGKYAADCRIERRGRQVAGRTIPFEKLPLPEWYGNTIGVADRALKPFTPLRRSGGAIACWGREYRYEKGLLPSQITSQGRQLLAAPIELVLTDAGGRQFSSAEAQTRVSWGKQSGFRVEFQRSCRLGQSAVQTDCWIECDGLLWTTLKISPSQQAVKHLALRVRMPKQSSEYINANDYSTATTGRLKPQGWQGEGPTLWLGGPDGGLQFTAETLAACRLASGTQPLRAAAGPENNMIELTLIDQPRESIAPGKSPGAGSRRPSGH